MASQRHIALYRAKDFPLGWELDRLLVDDVLAADPTMYHDGDTWWLFASVFEPGYSADDELFVWSAPSLDGEWQSHPLNPVVSDVRCARPAGRLFVQDGELIRPTQDGSRGYGSAITLRKVVTLTPTEYGEETIGRISPDVLRGAHGTHTVNGNDRFVVVDGEGFRFRWR